MTTPSKPHNIYIHDVLWQEASTLARAQNVSTASVINSALGTYLSTNSVSVASGAQTTIQFEVDASGPTHRKPEVKLHTSAQLGVDDDDVPV